MNTIICTCCGSSLQKEQFKIRTDTGKKRRQCNKCVTDKVRQRNPLKPKKIPLSKEEKRINRHKKYLRNKDKIKRQAKKYYKKNKKNISLHRKEKYIINIEFEQKRRKEYYWRDISKTRQRAKEKRAKNKERNRKINRNWYFKTKDIRRIKRQEYREKNLEKERKRTSTYARNKAKNDVGFRIKQILRSRLGYILRNINVIKQESSLSLLGCTISDFIIYIESKFYNGMSWSCFGKGIGTWQIDHIIPLHKFDLTKVDQQRKAFHYTNNQPLWYDDHIKKSSLETSNLHRE